MSEPDETLHGKAAALEDAFRRIETTAMAEVPILNRKLSVQCVGMGRFAQDWLCVLITPWFINLVLLPSSNAVPSQTGAKTRVAMPGGIFEFIQSHHEAIGPYRMCSLMSPVFEFDQQEDAVTIAESILAQVLAPEEESATEDADMLAIWEGRMPQAEHQARPETEQLSPASDLSEVKDEAPKRLTRRAMFGLHQASEATP